MIYLERTITIANSSASIDEPIVLYKGDRNVEIQFVLKNSPFRYKSSTNPTYGQLIINRENADSIFSDVSETVKGKILFVITGDMIDELNECGNYDFQIRLFNEDKTSRVTLMPIIAGITIREPICEDDEESTVNYYEYLFSQRTNNGTDMSYLFNNFSGSYLDVSNLDTSNVTNMKQMFYSCKSLTSIGDVSNWDTKNVTDMSNIFCGCSKLTSLDVSNWDTSNATDMGSMFYYCESLTSLDLSNWDTSKVTNVNSMFQNCYKLTTLDVSNWDTSNVTKMGTLFGNCWSLTQLDVSNWDISNVTNMNSMFYSCNKLTTLDLSNWDINNITDMNYMLSGCSSLHTIRLCNCSNNTINKIITGKDFPTNAISGVTRTIYCKEENAAGLTPPTNWVFSFINN